MVPLSGDHRPRSRPRAGGGGQRATAEWDTASRRHVGAPLVAGACFGPGMFFTAAAGYVGPAVFGLGAAYLLRQGHSVALLWTVLVVLALVLILIRNWFGLWLVLAAGIGVFAISWWGDALVQSFCAYVGAWFLLTSRPLAPSSSCRQPAIAGLHPTPTPTHWLASRVSPV